jgi:hypothetical protein
MRRKYVHVSPETTEKIAELYNAGQSQPAISAQLNLSSGAIRNHLKKAGVHIRPHGRPGESNPNYRHGAGATGTDRIPEYAAYHNAKQRCENPNNDRYVDWGGRGIKFLFASFEQFSAELGHKPTPEHQLDRKDNDGNYEPGNVRWATLTVQATNKRPPIRVADRSPLTGRYIPTRKEEAA